MKNIQRTSDYDTNLDLAFGNLVINLCAHDTSPCGLPAYIEVQLGKAPKDKGATVLDLGNYIYRRFGLRYQMTPEYCGRGKSTTLRWFMSWDDIKPIRANIFKACMPEATERLVNLEHFLPVTFRTLIIQNPERGVRAPSNSTQETLR